MGKTPEKFTDKTDYDVVIIGAGLIGLSCADSLLTRGLSVCVTDIKSAPMEGVSFCNSGMLHPSQAAPWAQLGFGEAQRVVVGADVLSLAARSVELITTRAKELGLAQTDRAQGCLQIFPDNDSWTAAAQRCDALSIDYQRRPAGALFGDKPALFYPSDRSGNAYDYGVALAADIASRGADTVTEQGAAPWIEEGRVIGVRLGNRDIRARHTVLAAGPQSERLAARAGVSLPMKRAAGWAVNYKKPKGLDLPDYPVMEAGHCSALSIFGDTLRLSGSIGENSAEPLIRTWTALAPQLIAAIEDPIAEPWSAIRPVSVSGKPYIGRSALPGLWVNTGHGHMGWTLCAGSGELLAEMIVDGRSDVRFSVPSLSFVKYSAKF
jgi:D-amino-acid dehydrogenase